MCRKLSEVGGVSAASVPLVSVVSVLGRRRLSRQSETPVVRMDCAVTIPSYRESSAACDAPLRKGAGSGMKRLRLIGVALLAVFALSVVAASVAQAEEAPFWTVEGTRLAAGKTHFITTKIYKEGEAGQTLKLETPGAGVVVTCTGLNFPFETGVILGSNAGEPGTDNEVAHFTGCTVSGNGTKCAVEGKEVTTNPIKSELVENVENGKAGKKLLTEFSPLTGTSFVTLKFKAETGGKCTFTTTPVEGSAAAEVLNEKEVPVELPNKSEEFKSGLTRFPTTAISEVWLVKAGVGSAVSVGLKAFGLLASREVGTALVLLAKVTGTTLETEENTKWSALP